MPRCMTPISRQVKPWPLRLVNLRLVPSPFASLAPPEFGRLTNNAHDDHTDVLAGWPSEHPVMAQSGSRPRCLSVPLNDPAAAALFLRTHMTPGDLMELILILADAAAEELRARRATETIVPRRRAADIGR